MAGIPTDFNLSTLDDEGLLPREISEDIYTRARSESVVARLSKTEPVRIGTERVIPVSDSRPRAHIRRDGHIGRKGTEYGLRGVSMVPVIATVGVTLSRRSIMAAPASMLEDLKVGFASAIAEQIDLYALHGIEALTGDKVADGLADGLSTVKGAKGSEKTMSAQGFEAGAWKAYDSLISGAFSRTPTGAALDTRAYSVMGSATDTSGRPLYPNFGIGGQPENLVFAGVPTATSPSVSGAVPGYKDTGIRAIIGDWSALRYGVADRIDYKVIEYGDPLNRGYDLQHMDEVAIISEIDFGVAVLDKEAFVGITDPAITTTTTTASA